MLAHHPRSRKHRLSQNKRVDVLFSFLSLVRSVTLSFSFPRPRGDNTNGREQETSRIRLDSTFHPRTFSVLGFSLFSVRRGRFRLVLVRRVHTTRTLSLSRTPSRTLCSRTTTPRSSAAKRRDKIPAVAAGVDVRLVRPKKGQQARTKTVPLSSDANFRSRTQYSTEELSLYSPSSRCNTWRIAISWSIETFEHHRNTSH